MVQAIRDGQVTPGNFLPFLATTLSHMRWGMWNKQARVAIACDWQLENDPFQEFQHVTFIPL